MKIHNLKARGFIGIKKGMGLDEINLDLSDLSGLIALSGPNGNGKSTCMELLSPYRTLPSRPGALKSHVFLRDSFKDLTFEYSGDLYRTLVKVDSETDRSEGFIWKNGYPEIDGKVTNYNKYLVKLLGSANLFYNSVFCAQNSAKLSDMTTGQLKQLFAEFLRLDRLSTYESTSKKCIGLLNGMSIQEERGINSLTEKINKYGDLDQQLAMLVEDEKQLIKDKAAESVALRDAEESIEKLKEAVSQNKVNTERLEDIESSISKETINKTKIINENQQKTSAIRADQTDLRAEAARLTVITDQEPQIKGAAEKITETEAMIKKITADMEEIREQGERVAMEITQGQNQENKLTIEIMGLDKDPGVYGLQVRETEILSRLDAIDQKQVKRINEAKETKAANALSQVDAQLTFCKQTMALLDKRDPLCTSTTCSFITSALDAKEKAVELEIKRMGMLADIEAAAVITKAAEAQEKIEWEAIFKELEAVRADLAAERLAIEERRTELIKEVEAVKAANEEKATTRIALGNKWKTAKFLIDNELTPAIEVARVLAKKLPEVEIAKARIEDINIRLQKNTEAEATLDRDTREEILKIKDIISLLHVKKSEIEAKIIPDAEKKIEDAELNKKLHALNIEMTDDKISSNREKASITRQKIQEKEHAEKDLISRKAEYDRVRMEIHQWSYLRDACGKTGLQALEIDGVAPLVSGYANDLLNQSFGPNFSVKLVTQNIDTGREVLDIVVIRGDGSETLLENLSGGEKVWILKALRLAMTLVSKEKSGRNFESFMADEEDGPLDSEKAQNFIGLYRSMMSVGNFQDCFYISHNPDVVAMADHQILFSKAGIQVD